MTRKNSRQRHSRHLLLAVAAFAILAAPGGLFVQGQVESGKVVGTVRDSSEAVVTSAEVKVTEVTTNVTHAVKTDSNGEYVVTQLRPGTYTVTAEYAGFKRVMQAPFKLDVNQVARVNLTLVVGTVNEQVEVTVAEPLVESQTSSLGQVVEESRVHDLPLDGRNFVELSYLTPGVNAGPSLG